MVWIKVLFIFMYWLIAYEYLIVPAHFQKDYPLPSELPLHLCQKSIHWQEHFWTGRVRTFENLLLHKSNENTGKKLSQLTFSEVWKLTKVLHQYEEYLLRKNSWISIKQAFLCFNLLYPRPLFTFHPLGAGRRLQLKCLGAWDGEGCGCQRRTYRSSVVWASWELCL